MHTGESMHYIPCYKMETSHVQAKYLIILIKQALFFKSKHGCQVLNEN